MSVKEVDEMGAHLGITDPLNKTIFLRLDVYRGMCSGDPEHRFTAAHELGHMVMHSEVTFARMESNSDMRMVSFEGEADAFAVELLGFDSPANERVRKEVHQFLETMKQPAIYKSGRAT
jgi:Zn-dependent peptidase ImmA (M78 family)